MSDPAMDESDAARRSEPAPSGRARRVFVALLPLLIFASLSGIFLTQLLSGRDASEIPSALIGRPAPALELPPLDSLARGGEAIPGLSDALLDGKVSLVNVWASWCVPCRQEHPYLMALGEDQRVQVLGINYKDQPGNAVRFLGELGNPFDAVGVDQSGRTAIDWGVYGVPETYLVDASGTIVYKKVGPFSERSYLEELLPAIERAVAAE
jgi:cytochrome c biogenesis protein CcmG, thiol:disulfide interchange protein DsbE